MKRISILIVILALALSSLACSLTVNIPIEDVNTGPVQVDKIEIPAPTAEVVNLVMSFGAGKFEMSPGEDTYLVSGEATYNVKDFKPKVTVDNDTVKLDTGNLDLNGIPNFSSKIENAWDLRLGNQVMDLKINAGAYEGNFDLGGLSLRNLTISDGAADVRLDISEPNKVEMDSLRYTTGASSVRMKHLGNANFTEMAFKSGAGDYTLDFTGEWQRDAAVNIESGISNIVIVVPQGLSVKVVMKGGLTNVNSDKGWDKTGSTYVVTGSAGSPTLTITINMGAGNVDLRIR